MRDLPQVCAGIVSRRSKKTKSYVRLRNIPVCMNKGIWGRNEFIAVIVLISSQSP